MNYDALIPVLVEAVKAQQTQIEQLTKTLEDCRSWPKVADISEELRSQGARLDQNRPNPSDGNTEISFSVPAKVVAATLDVYDLRGELIRSFAVSGRSEGTVKIDEGSFPAGIYLYGLVLDGSLFEVKQMVFTR